MRLNGPVEDNGLVLSTFIDHLRGGGVAEFIVTASSASGEQVGLVRAGEGDGEWAPVGRADIDPAYRGKGIYPEMLRQLRDTAKAHGYKGIVSYGDEREGKMSTASWVKFARRDRRVKRRGNDFFLSGLPKKGRISLATAKRAMAKLPPKVRACGFTVEQLREGMEVEREHRDVTKGAALKTAKIAAAHLCEFPRGGYYPGLKRLERKLKKRR
jgi:GNAT superfamily N-acetyltransferase